MFEMEVLYGEIRIDNDLFKKKVLKWLDNNEEYLKQAYKQVSILQNCKNERKIAYKIKHTR